MRIGDVNSEHHIFRLSWGVSAFLFNPAHGEVGWLLIFRNPIMTLPISRPALGAVNPLAVASAIAAAFTSYAFAQANQEKILTHVFPHHAT